MPYYVALPDGNTVEVPDDVPQSVARQRILEAYPELRGPKRGLGSLFVESAKKGVGQMGVAFGDVLPAMAGRLVGADEYADRQMEEARRTTAELEAKYPTEFRSYEDIGSVGDAVRYGVETLGQGLPSLIPGLFTGGAGAILTRGMAAGLGRTAAIGGATAVGSASQTIPEAYSSILAETGQEALGPALVAGTVNAALESVLPAGLLSRFTGPARQAFVGSVARRLGFGVAEGAVAEGLTEGAQEAINNAAVTFVDENKEFFTSDNWKQVLDSMIRGAIVGGPVTGAANVAFGQAPPPERRGLTAQEMEGIRTDVETSRLPTESELVSLVQGPGADVLRLPAPPAAAPEAPLALEDQRGIVGLLPAPEPRTLALPAPSEENRPTGPGEPPVFRRVAARDIGVDRQRFQEVRDRIRELFPAASRDEIREIENRVMQTAPISVADIGATFDMPPSAGTGVDPFATVPERRAETAAPAVAAVEPVRAAEEAGFYTPPPIPKKPKEPTSLSKFIEGLGGIRESQGYSDIVSQLPRAESGKVLKPKSGKMTVEQAAESAIEAGYIPNFMSVRDPNETNVDLLGRAKSKEAVEAFKTALVEDRNNFRKYYSEKQDPDAIRDWEDYQSIVRENDEFNRISEQFEQQIDDTLRSYEIDPADPANTTLRTYAIEAMRRDPSIDPDLALDNAIDRLTKLGIETGEIQAAIRGGVQQIPRVRRETMGEVQGLDVNNPVERLDILRRAVERFNRRDESLPKYLSDIARAQRDLQDFRDAQRVEQTGTKKERDARAKNLKKAVDDAVTFGMKAEYQDRVRKSVPPPKVTTEAQRREAIARLNAKIQEIAGEGEQGKLIADGILRAVRDRTLTPSQVAVAFEAADITGRLLNSTGARHNLRFVQSLAYGPYAARGVRIADVRNRLDGMIKLALDPESMLVVGETAAHEAFHVLQDVFAMSDPGGMRIIEDAFKGAKSLADIDPLLVRKLKDLKDPSGSNYYDRLNRQISDVLPKYSQQVREKELQAFVFGALDDAYRRGQNIGGIGAAYRRALSFFQNFVARLRNYLRGDGFRTVSDITDQISRGQTPRATGPSRALVPTDLATPAEEPRDREVQPSLAQVEGSISSRINAMPEDAFTRRVAEKTMSASDTIKEFFNPFYGVDQIERLNEFRNKTQGTIAVENQIARRLADTIDRGTDEDRRQVYSYLTTRNADPDSITDQSIRRAAVEAKNKINSLAQQMIEQGLLSQEAFDRHYDQYLPRLYLRYVMEGELRMGRNFTIGPRDYLKMRDEDLTEDERKLLGEIKEPAFLVYVALMRPSKDLAVGKYLNNIANAEGTAWVMPNSLVDWQGAKVTPFWLRAEADQLRNTLAPITERVDPDGAAQMRERADLMDQVANDALKDFGEYDTKAYVRLPDSARYGALRGAVVQRGIAEDIKGAFVGITPEESRNWFQKMFGDESSAAVKATQLWKMSKVTLNVPSQVRNLVSNLIMLNLSGVPATRIPGLMLRAIGEMRAGSPAYQKAMEYGITGTTMTTGELSNAQMMLQRFLRNNPEGGGIPGMFAAARNAFSRVLEKTSDAYQSVESMVKFMKFLDATEREGLSPSAAVDVANEYLFDYSLVNNGVRTARNSPLGLPFITYYYKALPVLLKTAKEHPYRFLPYAAMMAAIPAIATAALDIEEEDYEKLRKSLPEYLRNKNSLYLFPAKDENGRWVFFDMGPFLPWQTYVDAATAAFRGDGKDALRMVTPSSPVLSVITALTTNKDPFTGKDIVDSRMSPKDKAFSIVNYMWSMAAPPMLSFDYGAIPQMYRETFGDGTGKTEKGDPTPGMVNATARLMGVVATPIDAEMQRARNIQYMINQVHKIESLRGEVVRDQSLSPERRREKVMEINERIREEYKKVQEYASETAPTESLRRSGAR